HLFEEFERRGIEFRCLGTQIDTTNAMGRAFLTIMLAFAQLERDINSERTRAGVAMYRTDANGKITKPWGRKSLATAAQLRRAKRLMEDGTLSAKEVYGALGVSRTTFYRSFVPRLIRPSHPIDQFALDNDEIEEAG
ncbi:MAG TPA: recombinase family protein, partial [Chloroflexota bacterium]|nr:recombinase family protein [Chloroflexota bacterium]